MSSFVDAGRTYVIPQRAFQRQARAAACHYASDKDRHGMQLRSDQSISVLKRPPAAAAPPVMDGERMQQLPLAVVAAGQHHPSGAALSERVTDLRAADLEYDLPSDRIATQPAQPRDSARMLVVWRSQPDRVEHRQVCDLPEYLQPGDALVFNTTSVLPARLDLQRETGGRVESLFLEDLASDSDDGSFRWRMLLRSGGRLAIGDRLDMLDHAARPTGYVLTIVKHQGDEWILNLGSPSEGKGVCRNTNEILQRFGRTPLPPYILKARVSQEEQVPDEQDRRWYQTVYADATAAGSVAAPTAGLHFTPVLLARIQMMGIQRIDISLNVGPGTFKPVTAQTLAEHPMHTEHFEIGADALRALRELRAARHIAGQTAIDHNRPSAVDRHRRRVIAVGTTTVRALESVPEAWIIPLKDTTTGSEFCGNYRGMTDLLIAPPHVFRVVDGLLTNFHLPRSTLLALIAAMLGLNRVKDLYALAIDRGYRFYSYGDAMLILP